MMPFEHRYMKDMILISEEIVGNFNNSLTRNFCKVLGILEMI